MLAIFNILGIIPTKVLIVPSQRKATISGIYSRVISGLQYSSRRVSFGTNSSRTVSMVTGASRNIILLG